MKLTLRTLRKIINESIDKELEREIKLLMRDPHTASVELFVEFKMEEGEDFFDAAELQAIAKRRWLKEGGDRRGIVPSRYTKQVKTELIEYGLKFIPREPERTTRGYAAGYHGTHPFAGAGSGGTGFSTSRDGPGFTSYGGGPGAIGGGYDWDANDPKNLSMGAKRKKR